MTFSDIFKSSFLESVTEFSALDTLIGMLAALEAFAAKHMIDPVLSRRMISAAEELTALILDRIRKDEVLLYERS